MFVLSASLFAIVANLFTSNIKYFNVRWGMSLWWELAESSNKHISVIFKRYINKICSHLYTKEEDKKGNIMANACWNSYGFIFINVFILRLLMLLGKFLAIFNSVNFLRIRMLMSFHLFGSLPIGSLLLVFCVSIIFIIFCRSFIQYTLSIIVFCL